MRSVTVLCALLLTGTLSFAVPLDDPALARYIGNPTIEDELLKPSQRRRNSNIVARTPSTGPIMQRRDSTVEDELLKTSLQLSHDSEVEDELLKPSIKSRDGEVEDELLKTSLQLSHDNEVEDELLKTTVAS